MRRAVALACIALLSVLALGLLGSCAQDSAPAGGVPDEAVAARVEPSDRLAMVDTQIVPRGVKDSRVLDAVRTVPRHEFVPRAQRHRAYEDRALPIGEGQTISQPYIVALMTELLDVQDLSLIHI